MRRLALFALLALCAAPPASAAGGLPILVYHRVVETPRPGDVPLTAITLARFEAQMALLHAEGYRALTMAEVVDYLKGGAYPEKVVAIHFDDGWKSAQMALPVLRRYGFAASFWIIAGLGGPDSPHMGRDEIAALEAEPLFEVESHTLTHPWEDGDTLVDWAAGRRAGKSGEDAAFELTESRRLLEERLGRRIRYLAWPRGRYDAGLMAMAQNAGYEALLTIDDGVNRPGGDLMRIRRSMVNGACGLDAFAVLLRDGVYRECAW